MNNFLCVLAVVAVTTVIGCKRSGLPAREPSGKVPAELLTAGDTYWTVSTVASADFNNTGSAVYHNYLGKGEGNVVFFKFRPGGYFTKLIYIEKDNAAQEKSTWISIEGTVNFATLKLQPAFVTHATSGMYRYRRSGVEYTREVPVEELLTLHSSAFLWKVGNIPGSYGGRYLEMLNAERLTLDVER